MVEAGGDCGCGCPNRSISLFFFSYRQKFLGLSLMQSSRSKAADPNQRV